MYIKNNRPMEVTILRLKYKVWLRNDLDAWMMIKIKMYTNPCVCFPLSTLFVRIQRPLLSILNIYNAIMNGLSYFLIASN